MGACKSKPETISDNQSDQQLGDDTLATSLSPDQQSAQSREPKINAKQIISQFGFHKQQNNTNQNNYNHNDDGCQKTPDLSATIETVILSTRSEVNDLLRSINEFQGTSSDDKSYKYLDEMLTRCILRLDQIECNNSDERNSRKEAIRGVNEAIAILERKLTINTDIRNMELNLNNED